MGCGTVDVVEGIELRKALEEASNLVGARLARVHQLDQVFFLRWFSPPGALVLDVVDKSFHRTALRPPMPAEPPPFCRLLRRLEGQPLLALEQAGYDRVIRLRFPGGAVVLDLRPRQGNLFFQDDQGTTRGLQPGELAPAPLGEEGDPLVGLGPALRRAARAALGGEADQEQLRDFVAELARRPPAGFVYATDDPPTASFFPRPELGAPQERLPTFWQALDRRREARLGMRWARDQLPALRRAAGRRRRALAALQQAEQEAARWEEIQGQANLLLARLSQVPRGSGPVELEGFHGERVVLQLDPARSPAENAQALYRRAGKLRRRLQAIPQRRQTLERELREISELANTLAAQPQLAPYLEDRLAQLGAAGQRGQPAQRPAPRPREVRLGGFTAWVGRSARENDALVRHAKPHDLWFHARGVPGGHVVVRTDGRPVPPEVVQQAARLAAWHSKARGERKVPVSYTEVRHLRKPKGAAPGAVRMLKENVIVVAAEVEP
ncbi:MAG: NFACT RNA binding domain-containing protein [Candidatus Bipolaricaulaceae bacterium]